MIKRYVIFAGDNYYPVGGWDDFISSHDTKAEAEVELKSMHKDCWKQIIDLHTGNDVWNEPT